VPSHKVKTHRWVNGFLAVEEQMFETEADALYFARTTTAGSVKVFTTDGDLIHVRTNSGLHPTVRKKIQAETLLESPFVFTPDDDSDDGYTYPDDDGYTYPDDSDDDGYDYPDDDNGYSYNDDFDFDDSYA
jgi:hypothetical protein